MATEATMRKVCCLYRLDGATETQLVVLDDKEKVTVGRHMDNDVILNESLTISRHHLILEKTNGAWAVLDLGSSNGIWVNGVRLAAEQSHRLSDRDIIEIGRDPKNEQAVYRYQFYKQAKIKTDASEEESEDASDKPPLRRLRETSQKKEEEESAKKEKEALEAKLEQLKVEHEAAHAAITERLAAAEANKDLAIELLEEEQRRLKEAAAREVQIRERLQKEMEEKLKAKDEEMSAELKTQIETLSSSLTTKEQEQSDLRNRIDLLQSEVETEKLRQQEVKEDIVNNIAVAMEEELVCAICSELLVQATSLGCSHSFCAHCIAQWMERKKICPNCRTDITSRVRSLALDNYIDKVVMVLGNDQQEKRKKLVEERKAEDVVMLHDKLLLGDETLNGLGPLPCEVQIFAGDTAHKLARRIQREEVTVKGRNLVFIQLNSYEYDPSRPYTMSAYRNLIHSIHDKNSQAMIYLSELMLWPGGYWRFIRSVNSALREEVEALRRSGLNVGLRNTQDLFMRSNGTIDRTCFSHTGSRKYTPEFSAEGKNGLTGDWKKIL